MSSPARRGRQQISSMQIVFGAILAISLLLAINFSGRIAAGRNIDGQRESLEQNIQTLQAQATALRSELNFYSSDAFVEQWARKEGKMVKQNEVLVIPVPAQTTPQAVPTAQVPVSMPGNEPKVENWQLWWQLFFDSPPPQDSGGN